MVFPFVSKTTPRPQPHLHDRKQPSWADLLRPGWLPLPRRGIATRPPGAIDAVGLPPVGLQPCRLLTPGPGLLSLRRSATSPRFLPPTLPLLRPNPALKYSVVIPNPRFPPNPVSSHLEDESPPSTSLPSSQIALMADLLRPRWLPIPRCGIATRQLLAIDAT
jgi:hypothetical protein